MELAFSSPHVSRAQRHASARTRTRVVRLGAQCTDHWTTEQSRGIDVPAVQLTTHVKVVPCTAQFYCLWKIYSYLITTNCTRNHVVSYANFQCEWRHSYWQLCTSIRLLGDNCTHTFTVNYTAKKKKSLMTVSRIKSSYKFPIQLQFFGGRKE